MTNNKVKFRFHALKRMFEREISEMDVLYVLSHGRIIEDYPSDNPYPSYLKFGYVNNRPIHVVAAKSEDDDVIIITVYEPDTQRWEPGFEKRKIK